MALLIAHPVSSSAADRLAQAAPENEPKASTSTESKDRPAAKSEGDKKRTPRRKKFRPSERITADSAVAFPVDI
jgi:hypothetical protein